MRRLRDTAAPGGDSWTPADIQEAIIALPTYDLSRLYTDDGETVSATAAGQEIFHARDLITNLDFDAEDSGRRPFLRNDDGRSGLHFLSSTANRYMDIQNSAGLFNSFHVNGTGAVLTWIRFDSAPSGSRTIFNSNNLTGANKGVGIFQASTGILRFAVSIGSGNSLSIDTSDTISGTDWTKVIIKVAQGANASSVQIGDGTPATGSFTLGLTTGSATSDMRLGLRTTSNDLPMNGQISNMVICSSIPSDEDIARWAAFNPPLG